MKLKIYVFMILSWLMKSTLSTSTAQLNCYPATAPMCSAPLNNLQLEKNVPSHRKSKGKRNIDEMELIQWPYNTTVYPSFADDKSAEDVITSLSYLHPLVSTKCSKFIKLFLCSVHSPVCTPRGVVPPCQELCEIVKSDCSHVAEMFSIDWPEVANCEIFPRFNPLTDCKTTAASENLREENEIDWTLVHRMTSIPWAEALLDDGRVCIPPTDDEVVTPAIERLNRCDDDRNMTFSENLDLGVSCPAELKSPPGHYGYTFMGLPNCSAPCPNMYLKNGDLWIVRYFILVMAVICIIVTLFTLLTFVIDIKRFSYPERPIVFYALSYLVVSVVFLLGFIFGESAACHEKVINSNNEVVQGYVVVEGSGHRLCSVMFLILYYFTVNGTIWWLILTITWLLAAGLGWGSEAIEERHLYYHAAAWGLPALQVLTVFVFNKIEGDNIAGLCYVGLHDSNALRLFVLLPMGIYLLAGTVILFLGFFYLNRVRKKLDADERNKKKLAKFMLRIGVFSILYILPQVALIVIYAVEDSKRIYWESTWYAESCADNSVPCPTPTHPVGVNSQDPQHPGVFLFCLKYMMTLVVALPPLFWVASKKTLKSWKYFCTRTKPSKNRLNTTETRLLSDTDGPHARDCQAKLEGKFDAPDEVFGEMCNSNLHGSSASVAAQMVSKGRASTLQRQWNDLTDSETSTYYSTSSMDSEMSRILEHESKKHQGTRIAGRKGVAPNRSNIILQSKLKNGNTARNSRTSSMNIHPQTSSKRYHHEKTKPVTSGIVKQYSLKKDEPAVAQNLKATCKGPQSVDPVPETLSKSSTKAGQSTWMSSQKPVDTYTKLLKSNRNPTSISEQQTSLQSTPVASQMSSNVSSETHRQTRKEKCKKPMSPPPPPPPRVDSVSPENTKSTERMLSL